MVIEWVLATHIVDNETKKFVMKSCAHTKHEMFNYFHEGIAPYDSIVLSLLINFLASLFTKILIVINDTINDGFLLKKTNLYLKKINVYEKV